MCPVEILEEFRRDVCSIRRMRIDGFDTRECTPFFGYSEAKARRIWGLVRQLGDVLHVEVSGIHNVPARRALLVANHAFGWDLAFPVEAIWRNTGRVVWTLGEHAWWFFPFLRRAATACGVVDGTQPNADMLLHAEQLVLVLPGGLREALKPRELRYRLLWGRRFGFVRTAIRNTAPIVPVAAIGSDELVDLVGNAFARGKRLLGRFAFPIPRPAHGLPIVHRVRLKYVIGEPILIPARPEDANDPAVLRRARHEIEGALQELIDVELARRSGFPIEMPDPEFDPAELDSALAAIRAADRPPSLYADH